MDTTIGVSFLDPLNDYELIHRIGSGTYGDVFKVSREWGKYQFARMRMHGFLIDYLWG